MPTVADLYAGAGLFSYGFKRAGFEVVDAIELDREAARSYARNVSATVRPGSVADLAPIRQADIVIAGPPCQGFSTLGRRDPKDARNQLCLEVVRWAAGAAARVVVVENVPPFLRSPQWQAMAEGLADLGLSVETWELDALDYGVPQRRRRSFTVASKVGPIGPPAPEKRGGNAGAAIKGMRRVLGPDPLHTWPVARGLAAERIRLVPPRGDKRDLLRTAPQLCPPSWARVGCHATDVWGRVDPDAPANTIRCTFQNPSKGRYLHPTENRVLSLREGARLQGIPESWQMFGDPYPVARQIGNGVPIQLGLAVARRVRAALA